MRKFSIVGVLSLAFLVSACASVPMSSVEDDAQAKKFAVPADQSRIYVYRNETLGAAVKITLALDGQVKGQTAKQVYYAWDVTPGAHEVNCFGESSSALDVHVKKARPSTFGRK